MTGRKALLLSVSCLLGIACAQGEGTGTQMPGYAASETGAAKDSSKQGGKTVTNTEAGMQEQPLPDDACTLEGYWSFFEAFVRSPQVRKTYTDEALRDRIEPFRIALEDDRWVYAGPARQGHELLDIQDSRDDRRFTVKYVRAEFGPDDEVISTHGEPGSYVFEFTGGCWKLTSARQGDTPKEVAQATPVGDLLRLAPPGASVLFHRAYKAPGSGRSYAVLVAQQGAEGARTLIVAEPDRTGAWQPVARNDRVIACATCGELRDDPFTDRLIELSPGRIAVEQRHGGFHASSSKYTFAAGTREGEWQVVAVENTRYAQQESGEWKRESSRVPVRPGTPLSAFDPGWRAPESWNAIVANERTLLTTAIVNKPDKAALDAAIREECASAGKCKVLVTQLHGCVAAAVNGAGRFHVAESQTGGKKEVTGHVLAACQDGGGNGCRLAAEGCSIGFD